MFRAQSDKVQLSTVARADAPVPCVFLGAFLLDEAVDYWNILWFWEAGSESVTGGAGHAIFKVRAFIEKNVQLKPLVQTHPPSQSFQATVLGAGSYQESGDAFPLGAHHYLSVWDELSVCLVYSLKKLV